jgi:hypothetical protein
MGARALGLNVLEQKTGGPQAVVDPLLGGLEAVVDPLLGGLQAVVDLLLGEPPSVLDRWGASGLQPNNQYSNPALAVVINNIKKFIGAHKSVFCGPLVR